MWQIFRTDLKGKITGELFSDPAKAVATFIGDYKYAKGIYSEICFRKLGDLALRIADDKLKYAILRKRKTGSISVEFPCLDLEGTKGYLEPFIPDSSDITVLSFETGEIKYEYHSEYYE